MTKLKFQGTNSNQVLFLNPELEPTLPKSTTNYYDYVRNYTNHIAWETSNMMNDGTSNINYDSSINNFKQFLLNKGIKFSAIEKFNKSIKANVTRIIVSKDQVTIEE
jgi:ABC-type antimicrobial peptide transport system permease subunit